MVTKDEIRKKFRDKTEEEIIEEEFEKVKALLQSEKNGYNKPFIQRQLHENNSLRKVYLAIIKNNPAKISEISEDALLTKPTCYTQLHKLLELHLVERIFVIDVMNGTIKHDKIKTKFLDWTKNMPEQLRRYYLAKTSFWVISNLGKQFAMKSWEFDQEFREKDKKEGENG
ncbi:MAG: winged helix-turn-helix domain-containing protein [Candidatus Heimdallarchaeaceae archaeon]